ncbi:MAG: hypothetical protein JST84_00130 [Acidobacteria bacterium]|nr:hypothetical protein [Acidobacteriota bacterium]
MATIIFARWQFFAFSTKAHKQLTEDWHCSNQYTILPLPELFRISCGTLRSSRRQKHENSIFRTGIGLAVFDMKAWISEGGKYEH